MNMYKSMALLELVLGGALLYFAKDAPKGAPKYVHYIAGGYFLLGAYYNATGRIQITG